MRVPYYPWELRALRTGKPTVGWLMELCDENFRQLLRLAPSMRILRGYHVSTIAGSLDLHMEIVEQTPYTTLVHLTYVFPHSADSRPDPDALLRVYHDSRQVEVVDLKQRALPLNSGSILPTLKQKWRVNLFLSKWLGYCVQQGHRFGRQSQAHSGKDGAVRHNNRVTAC